MRTLLSLDRLDPLVRTLSSQDLLAQMDRLLLSLDLQGQMDRLDRLVRHLHLSQMVVGFLGLMGRLILPQLECLP